ncbi:thioredoxin family protein [Flavobacterium sp. '19STA2R22 D10 B1']|uniref:thioredoxin family protein n=1 Tax=Flavobacterium aerium TaxID=3037261 RepID=UPI00278C0F84|nr:thioredoxin family protein [Flavobacterium sp. '19STA2R22 D10 B1']
MKNIITNSLAQSYSYKEYRSVVAALLVEGKSTGHQQSEDLTQYSLLNETRMNRLEKTMVITPENQQKLQALKGDYIWLVISEGWCGDAAQLLPIFHKMVEYSEAIELKIVLRDDNELLMNQFLTNGGKSIPKLIIVERESLKVLADWGPRPQGATDLIKNYKAEFGVIDETAKINLQKWYLADKGISTQNELITLMQQL